jgi:hypothetical protein
MMSASGTLSEMVVERLVEQFSMEQGDAQRLPGDDATIWFLSVEHDFELLASGDLGVIILQPLSSESPWQLTFRAIGSAQNWLTAELAGDGLLGDMAQSRLHEIDWALDGLLRQALLARGSLLAHRRDHLLEISRSILREHAEAQRVENLLDLRWHDRTRMETIRRADEGDFLPHYWLRWPERSAATVEMERVNLIALESSGSPAGGYRFYLECTTHARSLEEAALSLADELFTALTDGAMTASIEPLGLSGALIDAYLQTLTFHTPELPDGPTPRHPLGKPGSQGAMTRLGA